MKSIRASNRAWLLLAACIAFLPDVSAGVTGVNDFFDAGTIRPVDIPTDAPKFEAYSSGDVFKGEPALPDVKSDPRSKLFRTAIREGARRGPNFAGHYTIVSWGCGAATACWAIVDAQSGEVFHPANLQTTDNVNIDYAIADADDRLVQYRPDSKLLVVIGGINEDPELRGISYFVWEHNALNRIRFVPKTYE
ncbi:hypothetical protein FE236_00315 [Mariprofundus erugo]|nr:hypothetical protein FE236_00315 [Mariprofundus erugo]